MHFIFFLFSAVSALKIRSVVDRRSSRLFAMVPKVKNVPISDFYHGVDEHLIKDVYVSEDLTKIYYKEPVPLEEADPFDKTNNPRDPENNDNVLVFKSITTNPPVTTKLMEYSEKANVHTEFISIPPNPVQQVFNAVGGPLDFFFMSFFLFFIGFISIICWN